MGNFAEQHRGTSASVIIRAAFDAFFGDRAHDLPLQSASEDFSDLPNALNTPYSYWGIGGIDPETYHAAEAAGRISQDIQTNHSPNFAPVLQPSLDTGTQALVTAALAWLAPAPTSQRVGGAAP